MRASRAAALAPASPALVLDDEAELLQSEEAQVVAHEHGDALLAGAAGDDALEATQGHDIGGEAEVMSG